MPEITCPAQGCTQTFRDDLDATVLTQLISIHAQSAHPPTAPQPQLQVAKMERVRRPTISSAGSTEEWEYFLSRWDEYKLATRMAGQDILIQLIECADEDLRKDLNRAYGTLTNDTEENALKKMKTLARGVKCSGFPSWEEGKKFYNFKKKIVRKRRGMWEFMVG